MQYLFLILFGYCAYKFWDISRYTRNPYTLKIIVGSKGSGKSLLLAKIANDHRGQVYSNMGIGFDLEPEYWRQTFPPDSLILIDEIGVIHSNRDFKSMPREAIEWYKMQRKNRLTVVVSSQTMDIDKKIRDLADRIILVRRHGFFCVARSYISTITMVQTPDGGHDLVNDIKLSGLYKVYSIPKTGSLMEKLGYKTEQIITKENNDDAEKNETRRHETLRIRH